MGIILIATTIIIFKAWVIFVVVVKVFLKKPAFGKNMLGNVMQEEEPYKIPSPREKRKRFQPAFNAVALLGGGGGGGGLGVRGLGGNGGGLMKLLKNSDTYYY